MTGLKAPYLSRPSAHSSSEWPEQNKTHVRSRWPNTGGGRILRPCAVGLYKAGCTPHGTRPRNSWLGLSAMLTSSIQTNQLELPGAHDKARPRGDEKKVNSDRHPPHVPYLSSRTLCEPAYFWITVYISRWQVLTTIHCCRLGGFQICQPPQSVWSI